MTAHFADRLMVSIRDKDSPACVGFDPLIERLPPALRTAPGSGCREMVSAILAFGRGVFEAVAPHVPAVKINIAFFEPFYSEGVRAYHQLVQEAHAAGLIVIGDVKRADIGHSSTQYARAHLGGADYADVAENAVPDAVTVNPYFGLDGVRPFIEVAREKGRGLFVLVQTSNESAATVQGLTAGDGRPISQHVARLVQEWASPEGLIGDSGYSCVGAVVSPRDLESTVEIRRLMPNCLFLVPGFGAQGRSAEEVAKCFKADGSGALVNASRSVIYAQEKIKYRDKYGDDWRGCVEGACKDFVASLREAMPHADHRLG